MSLSLSPTLLPVITNDEYDAILFYAASENKAELLKFIQLALKRRLFSAEQIPTIIKINNNFIDYKVPTKVSYSYESLINTIRNKLFLNSFTSFQNSIDYRIQANSVVFTDFMKEVDHLREEVSEYTSNSKKYSDESKLLDYHRLPDIVDQYNSQIKDYIPTGYKSLDFNLSGGLRKTRLYMFVGRTGIGKSTILRNVGWNLVNSGYNVLHITLEMTALETLVAYLPLVLNKPLNDIISRNHNLMEYENEIKTKLYDKLQIAEFLSNEEAKNIRSLMLLLKKKPDVLIIDYLDCLTPTQDWTLVLPMMQELKSLATEYGMAVVTAAQFNRSAEAGSEEHSSIAGSFSKVTKAETVILLRQSFNDKTSKTIKLFVSKNRWGKAGVEMQFKIDYDYLKLFDITI